MRSARTSAGRRFRHRRHDGGRGHGPIDLAAVSVGDRATVRARLPKRLAGNLPELVAAKAKGLIVKHAKSPGHKAPAGR